MKFTDPGRESSPVGRTDFKSDGRRMTPLVCSTHTSSAIHESRLRELPSVDLLLKAPLADELVQEHGHSIVLSHARRLLDEVRNHIREGASPVPNMALLDEQLARRVADSVSTRLKRIFNLSGTVIHTNLGRAQLAEAATARVASLMGSATNLEYDLESGARGDRDSIVEALLCQLTGAEAATVVNNNAAAVLLSLFALGRGREAIVSRGELVEIGGAFRMPDVMESAGVRMIEVGTTNRTHLADYERAIGQQTALLMKVHTSNYVIQGFTSSVKEAELARLAQANGLPLVSDLGSGSLVDLSRHGLPAEPMPQQMLRDGCDVVTFSGDKLLGGPQAGVIVGKRAFIDRIRKCPLKRALRVSKMPLIALEATLQLYLRPERLLLDLPTLRLLTRPRHDIETLALQLMDEVSEAVAPHFTVTTVDTESQIGSGALPQACIASCGLAFIPAAVARKQINAALHHLAATLRRLPEPVLGRIDKDRLVLDLRCLERPEDFRAQLPVLKRLLAAGHS